MTDRENESLLNCKLRNHFGICVMPTKEASRGPEKDVVENCKVMFDDEVAANNKTKAQ